MQNGLAYKVTRGVLLGNVARLQEDAEFAALAAEEITCTSITPALLEFVSGGGIADMVTASASVDVPTVAAADTQAVTVPVAGAALGQAAVVTFSDALAAGLVCNAHVSADGVLSLRFTNASGSSIAGATKVAKILLFTIP